MMTTAGIDDSLVDWSVKLAQPAFRSWFSESLDQAIKLNQPMSPDAVAPLIAEHAPRTMLEQDLILRNAGRLPFYLLSRYCRL